MAEKTVSINVDEFAESIGRAIAQNTEKKYVKYGRQDIANVFNPKGIRNRKLKRQCFQNGFKLDERYLHDEEIALLDEVKQGTYVNGKVTVLERMTGELEPVILIMYKNKTPDHKHDLASEGCYNLTAMLRMIVQEGKDRDAAIATAKRNEIRSAIED